MGSKMSVGGDSKGFKSWSLMNLALSVGYNLKWMGFSTSRSKVLVCNFEIAAPFSRQRLNVIAKARGIAQEKGRIDIWNLRGYSAPYDVICPQIIDRVRGGGYGLIILDPLYKLYGDSDENSARDVARLLNAIEEVTVETGAAVAYGSHFSKGNQSGKKSIDRVSGSGVFARDPDTLVTFTRHEEEGCFTVETVARNFPPPDRFVVRWDYPLFKVDDSLDPDKLETRTSRETTFTAEQLLDNLGNRAFTSKEWMAASTCGQSTFYKLMKTLKDTDQVRKDDDGKWVKA